jgi:hypothetical protein
MGKRLFVLFLSAMMVLAPLPAIASPEPNWDDLTERRQAAVDAPVHTNGGRSATQNVAVGAGSGLASLLPKIGAGLLGPIGSKVLAGAVPFVGGLAVGALTQKFLQGKIEWGPLIASALGSAGAVAVAAALMTNPAGWALIAAGVAGGFVGEGAYRGLIGMFKDRKRNE